MAVRDATTHVVDEQFARDFAARWQEAWNSCVPERVTELCTEDVLRHGAGVRAQAVDAKGSLVQDFSIVEAERMLHVLNAPSPAATASLSIGALIAKRAQQVFWR